MIDTDLASFLERGIAIQLGTRNDRLEPSGVRVVAVAVEPGGTHLVAYVPEVSAPTVLPDLETNGQAALVFSQPPEEIACQVKGVFTGAWTPSATERALVEAQWDRWLVRLTTIGYPRSAFGHWITWPCVAIRVQVNAIFNQTPGPGAGAPIA